jgi:enoyl-CoA hydratase/carnithine racemase
MKTAMEIAAQIASKSPIAVKISKQSLNAVEELGLRDGYRIEQDYGAELAQHPDSAEAMRAYWERRPPKFTRR